MWRFKRYLDITYFFEGHKFWLILMSTNLETPTNHALVGHIWPQTWKPQKKYIFVFIFKQGKQCKNAELADVGGKLSPSGHQMYQASIDNVHNCSWKPGCLLCECRVWIVFEKWPLHMWGPHCQCAQLYLYNSFQVQRIAYMFMNEDTVFQTKIVAVEFHVSFVLPSGYHYWR